VRKICQPKKSARVIGLVLLLSAPVAADEIVARKDGREIRLRDDFTWEYLDKASAARNPFEDVETREIVKKASDHMRKSLANAVGRVELALLQYQTGANRTLKGVGEAYRRADLDVEEGKPLFEQASARLASNAKASEALNETYIYWKASIEQLSVIGRESINGRYRVRMAERESGLKEKVDRLDLALSYLSNAVPTVSEIKGEPAPARAAVPTNKK